MSLERLLSDDQTTLSLPRWLDRGIVVAVVLAGIGLFTPIETHAVKLDNPPPQQAS